METLIQQSDALIWTCDCGESLRFGESASTIEVDDAIWIHKAAHEPTAEKVSGIARRMAEVVRHKQAVDLRNADVVVRVDSRGPLFGFLSRLAKRL